MRICHISDFHGNFDLLKNYNLPTPDFWIWTGDMFSNHPNNQLNYNCEIDWQTKEFEANAKLYERTFKQTPLFVVDGNHDYIEAAKKLSSLCLNVLPVNIKPAIYNNIIYSGFPYIPYMNGFFNNQKEIKTLNKIVEESIQPEVNLLITHIPPLNILDKEKHDNFGLKHLRQKLENKSNNLKLHCFGHVHESCGIMLKGNVLFSNAAQSINIIDIDF